MKKTFALIMALALTLSLLAGCAGSGSGSAAGGSPSPVTATGPGAAAEPDFEPIVLKFASNENPTSTDVTNFIEPWLDELEERCGGKIVIERHWSETLVSLPDTFQAVQNGLVDMAMFLPAMVAGQFPMEEVQRLTPMDVDVYRPSAVYWELYEKFPEMQAEWESVKLIGVTADIPSSIATNKPIYTLEDNQGLKMSVSGQILGAVGTALGWTSVSVSPNEVYSSLERGIIDGLPTQPKQLSGMKWGEVTQYLTRIPFGRAYQAYAMNLDVWNSLPADVQAVFEEMGGEYLAGLADVARRAADEEMQIEIQEEMGMEFIYLSDEEIARWMEVVEPVAGNFAADLDSKGLPGTELLETFYQLCEKYAAEEYAPK